MERDYLHISNNMTWKEVFIELGLYGKNFPDDISQFVEGVKVFYIKNGFLTKRQFNALKRILRYEKGNYGNDNWEDGIEQIKEKLIALKIIM